MIPGWPYSLVTALETGRSSWTAPLDARRLAPGDDAATVSSRCIASGRAYPACSANCQHVLTSTSASNARTTAYVGTGRPGSGCVGC